MPDRDPRDDVYEASLALSGVVNMLTECEGVIDRKGVEYVLRLIDERLAPAAERILMSDISERH